jgi:hypothetical protein
MISTPVTSDCLHCQRYRRSCRRLSQSSYPISLTAKWVDAAAAFSSMCNLEWVEHVADHLFPTADHLFPTVDRSETRC